MDLPLLEQFIDGGLVVTPLGPILKGQGHEIFVSWFFASNWSSWSPWDDFDFCQKFTRIYEYEIVYAV
jgi:hypothetical protein